MRGAAIAALLLVAVAALLVGVGTSVGPLSRTCSPEMDDLACVSAVDAVLRRGLDGLHPLIVSSHIEPGPDADPGSLGHRATVSFDLLALPTAASVELHYDQGGHWGGVLDRGREEIAAWALAPLVLAGLVGGGIASVAWSRRRDVPRDGDAATD